MYLDLQAARRCSGVAPGVVLLLQLLHDGEKHLEGLKGLLGVLDGELGVLILLPLRALVHCFNSTCLCRQDMGVHECTHAHTPAQADMHIGTHRCMCAHAPAQKQDILV